jgi:hypothetical protein
LPFLGVVVLEEKLPTVLPDPPGFVRQDLGSKDFRFAPILDPKSITDVGVVTLREGKARGVKDVVSLFCFQAGYRCTGDDLMMTVGYVYSIRMDKRIPNVSRAVLHQALISSVKVARREMLKRRVPIYIAANRIHPVQVFKRLKLTFFLDSLDRLAANITPVIALQHLVSLNIPPRRITTSPSVLLVHPARLGHREHRYLDRERRGMLVRATDLDPDLGSVRRAMLIAPGRKGQSCRCAEMVVSGTCPLTQSEIQKPIRTNPLRFPKSSCGTWLHLASSRIAEIPSGRHTLKA